MVQASQYIELSNQVSISYFEKGASTGIPLILLHGLADSWHIFEPLISYFSETVHIYAMSLRGHGDSSRPDTNYDTKDFEEDLRLFMDELNIHKAVIVGASSGGFPARSFAINHPDRTMALVLLGTPATLQNIPIAREIRDNTISKLIDPIDKEFVVDFAKSTFSKAIPQEVMGNVIQENLKVPAKVWRGAMAGMMKEEFPDKLNEIEAPTLIIWGDQDKLLTRQSQEDMSKVISDSTFAILKNAGHLFYYEDPKEAATNILSFIERIQSKL